MASAAFLLAPDKHPKPADKLTHARWLNQTERLIHYRGNYRKVKPRRGGALGYLSNRGHLHEFNFGEFTDSDEIDTLKNLARFVPGEYLAVWTYGRSVTVLYLLQKASQEPKIYETSFRIDPLLARQRNLEGFETLRICLKTSTFQPDYHALLAELNAPQISVAKWFQAFGVDAARDLKDDDVAALWLDFESAAEALLCGVKIAGNLTRGFNSKIDEDARLPTKPYRSKARTARQVADAYHELKESIGPPDSELWQQRERAAAFYWDISDCKDSCSRLIAGSGKQGLGECAALGRLLIHYPVELYRDGPFLALAGFEAESANGHAYVDGFYCFAESVQQAGFTLAIFPSRLRGDFRKSFGILTFEDSPEPEHDYSAEVFLDIKGILKTDSLPKIEQWFRKEKADGWIVRAQADGRYQLIRCTEGAPESLEHSTPESWQAAAKRLNPRASFALLGLPDLLQPGQWTEGAYSGENTRSSKDPQRQKTIQRLDKLPESKPIRNAKQLCADFPRVLCHRQHRYMSMSLTVPHANDEALRLLIDDLLGKGCIESYGDAWLQGNTVFALSNSDTETAMIVRALSDLPLGSRIGIAIFPKQQFHYEIAPPPSGDAITSCVLSKQQIEDSRRRINLDDPDLYDYAMFGDMLHKGVEVDHECVQDVILQNSQRQFFSVDLGAFTFRHSNAIEALHQELLDNNMQALGDMVCEQFNNVFIRGYAAQDQSAYAVLMIPFSQTPFFEFYTHFEDGQSLTTSQANIRQDLPKGIRGQKIAANTTVADAWRNHCSKMQQLSESQPISKHSAALAELAAAMDEFLRRQTR